MTDETQQTPEKPFSQGLEGLRQPLFVLGILFLFWLIFGKIIPYFAFSHHAETAVAAAPAGNAPAEPKAIAANDADLPERVNRLEAKVRTLEDVMAASPKPAADAATSAPQSPQSPQTPADKDNVAQLEASLAQQQTAIQALEAQLGDMQARQSHQLAALTAFAPLKDAVLRGDGFGGELAQLAPLIQDNAKAQDITKQLAPLAEKGVGTLATLQSGFEVAVAKALEAKAHPGTLQRNLQSLIRIRKVGDVQGNDDEAVIARAEAALNHGQVEAALKELSALSPTASGVMAEWTDKAQVFIRARSLINALQVAIAEGGTPLKPPVAPIESVPESPPESSPEPLPESPAESPAKSSATAPDTVPAHP